jgi:putative ABC transport system ATP-binding protein
VAVARALANDPPILLADEPTANLDSQKGHAIMELLRTISREKNKTIVIVSHDTRIRDFVDRVLWLEDGQLRLIWSDGLTVDPVCLMVLEREHAIHTVEHHGEHFYFCGDECRQEFEKAPEKYHRAGQPS